MWFVTNAFFMLMLTGICLTGGYVYMRVQVKPRPATRRLYRGMEILLFWCYAWMLSLVAPSLQWERVFRALAYGVTPLLSSLMISYGYLLTGATCESGRLCKSIFILASIQGFLIGLYAFWHNDNLHQVGEICKALVIMMLVFYGTALFYFTIQVIYHRVMGNNLRGSYYLSIVTATFYLHWISSLALLHRSVEGLICFSPVYLVAVFFLIRHYHFYDPVPRLIKTILDDRDFGMVVFNKRLEIMDYNASFMKDILDYTTCRHVEALLEQIKPYAENPFSVDNLYARINDMGMNMVSGKLNISVNGAQRHYAYQLSPLTDQQGRRLATLLTFSNRTEMVRINRAYQEKNKELRYSNEILMAHLQESRELTQETQRSAMMREINDSLGHSMTEILVMLEASSYMLEAGESQEMIQKSIREALERVDQGILEMRRMVSKYREGRGLHD